MFFNFARTREEAEKREYAGIHGLPGFGAKYRPERCAAELEEQPYYQCSRAPGHGPDGLYCKQHAKMVEGK